MWNMSPGFSQYLYSYGSFNGSHMMVGYDNFQKKEKIWTETKQNNTIDTCFWGLEQGQNSYFSYINEF